MKAPLAFTALLLVIAPAAAQQPHDPWKALDGQTLVYVANGSGPALTLTQNLTAAAQQTGALLFIKTIPWSRYGATIPDHNDHAGQLAAAAWTARDVETVRRHAPKSRIVLVAHSSGNRVALAAAEQMAPDSLERMILLAPSVTAWYDIRPALKASKRGIDSHTSANDVTLDIAAGLFGTADGYRTATAGEVGFQLPRDPRFAKEFSGLRQHYWNDSMQSLHNFGGHHSWVRTRYLAENIVSLILRSD